MGSSKADPSTAVKAVAASALIVGTIAGVEYEFTTAVVAFGFGVGASC